MTSLPSWSDYGTYDESAHPELWNGVVGYWAPCLGPTGLRLHDVSRGNNWGTLTNMDAASDWVVSDGRYALDYDGSNDNVTASVTLTGAFSVSLWANRRSAGGGNSRVIWGASSTTYIATVKPTAVGTRSDTVSEVNFSGFTFVNDIWFHLMVIRDSANGTRIFKDGVESTSGIQTVTGTYTLNAIGRYSTAPTFNWDGLIDDAAAWNRTLSTSEIRDLYRLGRGGMLQRRSRRRGYVQQAGFRAHYATQRNAQLIGGGLR